MTEEQPRKRARTLFQLFLTFLKIGAFTFGGGYAMITLIQRDVVERRKWITQEELLEIIAVAESAPGSIAVNTATFLGVRICGFFGALSATLGVVLPSFWIIVALSFVLSQFQSAPAVQYAFFGIRAGVPVLICQALISMLRQCPRRAVSYGIAAAVLLAVAVLDFPVLLAVLCAALMGIVEHALLRSREKKSR